MPSGTMPYWSWAELVPGDPEESSGRIRIMVIVRRFFYAYGGGIALLLVWDQPTALDAVWVGGFAGVLVIWPAVYHAQVWLDWRRLTAYGSFVVLTASSSFAGALTGELVVGQDDPVEFLRENALGWVFSVFIASVAGTVQHRSAAKPEEFALEADES